MCLAAMVIAGVDIVYYAFDNDDAEPYGFSSKATYQKLHLSLEPPPLPLIRLDLGLSPAELYDA
jgi:guanine deaminase